MPFRPVLNYTDFLDFFSKKVEAVSEATDQASVAMFLPPATSTLNSSQLYTEADVAKVITEALSNSCELDPISTDILKQFLPELLIYISSILPMSQRSAIVAPRLKKTGYDQADVQDYRPLSGLTFMSKVVERLVCRQLVAYIEQNGLMSAIVKVVADFLTTADRGDITFLSLLGIQHC